MTIQVTGPNGNSIFFPASGYRDCLSRNLKNVGLYGFYRSSTPINHFSSYRLTFANSEWSYDSILFLNGYSVRAVAEEFEQQIKMKPAITRVYNRCLLSPVERHGITFERS